MGFGSERSVVAAGMSRLDWLLAQLRGKGQHVRNVSSYFVARVVTSALYIVVLPLFLKHQGNAAYGTLGMALVVFSYVSVLDLSIGYPVSLRLSRALARNSPRAGLVLRHAAPLFLAVAVVVGTLLYMSSAEITRLFELDPRYVVLFRLLAVASGFIIGSSYFCAVLQAHNRVDWINYSRLILDFSRAAGLALGAFTGVTVALAVVVVGCIGKAAAEFHLAKILAGGVGAFRPALNWRSTRAMWGLGAPMAILVVSGMILTSADRIYVDRAFGQAALAHYTVGADLCSKAYFIVWAITGSIYTTYVKRHATRVVTDNLVKISFYVVAAVSILIYAPIFLAARQILTLWISADFARASSMVLKLWALNAVLYLLTCVYHTALQGQGRSRILAGGGVAGVVVLVLALALMPRGSGINGAALAVIAAFGAQLLVLRGGFRRYDAFSLPGR
jgi:O-antigen/teichoic acid export membrane protein